MERIAFLMDDGERISCLLNPESLVLTRRAGLRPQRSSGGLVTGAELADDPIFFTGGGETQLTLDLLFDVNLSDSTIEADDVRQLTGPLWNLSENQHRGSGHGRPPCTRIVWGKALNMPGYITAIAERLEYFSNTGVPQRAWVRLSMLRSVDTEEDLVGGAIAPPIPPEDLSAATPVLDGEPDIIHETVAGDGAGGEGTSLCERLDQLADRYYGDPAQWRVLAWVNRVSHPLRLAAGQLVRVPSRWEVHFEVDLELRL